MVERTFTIMVRVTVNTSRIDLATLLCLTCPNVCDSSDGSCIFLISPPSAFRIAITSESVVFRIMNTAPSLCSVLEVSMSV